MNGGHEVGWESTVCPECGSIPGREAQRNWPCPSWMYPGARVRSKVDFANVPKGTVALVLEEDHTGWPVSWDLPHEGHLYTPLGHTTFVKPLVDWFNSWEAAQFLEPVE